LERIELQTTVRKTTGNSPARSLRRSGHIPAVLYGPKTDPVLLSVNIKDLEQVFKQGNVSQVILNLVIQNGEKITKAAMIKELQTHPVSGNFIHIDFYEIDMKRKIKVMVPADFGPRGGKATALRLPADADTTRPRAESDTNHVRCRGAKSFVDDRRYVRPGFLKFPISSRCLASTEIEGKPAFSCCFRFRTR
jgi:ribosomal protein L25 (general stress protein Ctc)